MGRGPTALLGAVAGGIAGGILLVTTHPTSAYTNDAYREGASFGFVLRYVTLGIAAALLVRAVRRGWRMPLPAIGLAVILAAAVLPPALDRETASEKRKAAATAIDDPAEREAAEARAGAIDGCVNSTKRRLEGTPQEGKIDAEDYCTCLIGAITAGPEDDSAQLQAMARQARTGQPSPRLARAAARCAREARTG